MGSLTLFLGIDGSVFSVSWEVESRQRFLMRRGSGAQ
jgi:hypothetical protein